MYVDYSQCVTQWRESGQQCVCRLSERVYIYYTSQTALVSNVLRRMLKAAWSMSSPLWICCGCRIGSWSNTRVGLQAIEKKRIALTRSHTDRACRLPDTHLSNWHLQSSGHVPPNNIAGIVDTVIRAVFHRRLLCNAMLYINSILIIRTLICTTC